MKTDTFVVESALSREWCAIHDITATGQFQEFRAVAVVHICGAVGVANRRFKSHAHDRFGSNFDITIQVEKVRSLGNIGRSHIC